MLLFPLVEDDVKRTVLALFLLLGTAQAKQKPGLNDYGTFLGPNKFKAHCVISDPGISGKPTVDVYTHGQIDCQRLQKFVNQAYIDSRNFLEHEGYVFFNNARVRNLTIRLLTLAELNNPENFSNTDKACMRDVDCESGAYFGRTFYEDGSYNINVYIAYKQLSGRYAKYSFLPTFKHELMHVILYRYKWHYSMDEKDEHALINRFLSWKNNK